MKTALVCVALGLVLLLTLQEAEAGRLVSEEGRREAKQPLSGTNLNRKMSVGTVEVRAVNADEPDNIKVTSTEDDGSGTDAESIDPTHRYFPDIVNPKTKKQDGN